MRLLLARHGETGTQYGGRYIGATDLPLSELGKRQARGLAEVLPAGISRCLCSPMRRARQTAQLALHGYGAECPLEIVEAFREVDFGRWEGLTFAEIVAQDQDLVAQWQQNPLLFRFPEGEQTGEFWQRVEQGLQAIIAGSDDNVLVVCHGGVIRVILCTLLGLPFAQYLSFAIAPAALTMLDVDGQRGVLQTLNVTAMAGMDTGER